jgi:predicted branched-subunit amino acid permease
LADIVPPTVGLALMFLNPVYFLLLMLDDLKQASRVAALVCGALAGPAFHWVSPEWGLLLTGLVGGTLAFLIVERWSPPPGESEHPASPKIGEGA